MNIRTLKKIVKSKKVKARIPLYVDPRNKWRRLIHAEALQACIDKGARYSKTDKLELDVVLYMDKKQLGFHDLDNRLKDVMDALQGRAGDRKQKRP